MRTTVDDGHELSALSMVLAETLPPASVLHAAVVQSVHAAEGMSPTTPADDQSVARWGSRMPDQLCAIAVIGNNASSHRLGRVMNSHDVVAEKASRNKVCVCARCY